VAQALSTPLSRFVVKDIANTTSAFKEMRLMGIHFKIFTETDNKVVECPACCAGGIAPAYFEKLASG